MLIALMGEGREQERAVPPLPQHHRAVRCLQAGQ